MRRDTSSVRCGCPLWLLQMLLCFWPFMTDGKALETGVGTDAALPMLAHIRSHRSGSMLVTLRLTLPGKDDWQLWLERGVVRSLDPGGLRSDVVSIWSCEAVKNNSEDRKVLMVIKTGLGLHCNVLMMCTVQHLPFWDLIGSMVPSLMWLQCQQGWYLGTSHLHVWIVHHW